MPAQVIAYGSVIPARDVATTLSLRQEGFVATIAVTPGEAVHAGEAMLTFEASATASAAYRQALSALALAQAQRAHTARLLAQRLATVDQLAQADTAVRDARSTLDAQRSEGAGRDRQSVAAPSDGIIGGIPVAEGDHVAAGAPLMSFTRLDDLVATVGVEPADQARVHPGQAARLEPVAGGPALDGRVLRLDGGLNPRTRLIDVDIGTGPGAVLAGAFYKASIVTGALSGWIVPHAAVLQDERGAYLFQANGGVAARVQVTVAQTQGGEDLVQGPLSAGEPVIVEGAGQLDDRMAIRGAAP